MKYTCPVKKTTHEFESHIELDKFCLNYFDDINMDPKEFIQSKIFLFKKNILMILIY